MATKEAVTAFYDNMISKVKVSFDYPRSYACANECADLGWYLPQDFLVVNDLSIIVGKHRGGRGKRQAQQAG